MTSASVSGRSAAGPWRVSYGIARRAGLPATALTSLRSPKVLTWLEESVASRDRLTHLSAELGDRLYGRIGAVAAAQDADTAALKPALVGLRRSVHRRRVPAPRETAANVRGALGPQTCELLDAYLSELGRAADLTHGLDDTAGDLDAAMAAAIRSTIAAVEFRHGIAVASPSLGKEVERWLRDAGHRPQRKKIIRLAKYISRAAAKTSPYSTFTMISPLDWSSPAPAGQVTDPWLEQSRSVLELNGEFWDAVCSALVTIPEVAELTPLAVNSSVPTTIDVGDTLLVIGRAPQEHVVELRCTPGVLTALEVVRQCGVDGRTRVLDALALRTGQPADSCRRFLARLAKLGVVHPQPPVPPDARSPWHALAAWLDRLELDKLQSIGKWVSELAGEIEAPMGVEDLPAHVDRLSAVERVTEGLAAELSVTAPVVQHETVVTAPRRHPIDDSWRNALDDVDLARRWLAPFDAALPLRLMTADWFARTIGADNAVAFPEFYRRFRAATAVDGDPELRRMIMAADQPFPAALGGFASDRVRELERIRREALALVPPTADSVCLDPGQISEQVAAMPEWLSGPQSVGCYLQQVGHGESLQLVINALHLGYGRAAGRINRLLNNGDLQPFSPESLPPTIAEFASCFGSTMNQRDHEANWIIDYPFGVRHDGARHVAPGDLVVGMDADSRTLTLSVSGGSETVMITPSHLGMSAEFVLPPAARLLERTFGPSLLVHPSAPPLSSADVTFSGGRARFPRVCIGRAVVQRTRWCIDVAHFPTRQPGEADALYLVRLANALADRGIGQRFFIRSWAGDRSAASKSRKPLYIDCASPVLVSVLERALVGAKLVVIDEALPDVLDVAERGHPYVEEFFVELTEAPGRSTVGGSR